jgi:hypothetical protein
VLIQKAPHHAPPPPPPRHGDHKKTDAVQLGHDVADIAHAAAGHIGEEAAEAATKVRFLGELGREEMMEMRAMVAREGRQVAVLGEQTVHAVQPHPYLRTGAALLNGAVAAGAVWHGVELLRSNGPVKKMEGLNHLVLGAGCGLISAHLSGGPEALGHVGGGLMVAHGAAEVGLGAYRAVRGHGTERKLGLLQAAHGGCLIGAELFHGAALPLCLAMAGLTGVQIYLHRQHQL